MQKKCGISAALFLSLQHFVVSFFFFLWFGQRGHLQDGIQAKML
jgi:hypothetical protein